MRSTLLIQSSSGMRRIQRQGKTCRVMCSAAPVKNSHDDERNVLDRRTLLGSSLVAWTAGLQAQEAQAVTANPLEFKKQIAKRRRKIPEEEFTEGENGLKYYDIEVGKGPEATTGIRVAIHYDIKWHGVTFMTSRQGAGVTGGTPFGFDVGTKAGQAGSTLSGIDLGVRGMRVGGLRRLILPPNLGYGSKGIGEVPPNAYLDVDLELLSIKNSAFGYQVKLVEG